MATIPTSPTITPAKGYSYLDTPQGSPDWVALRLARVTASRLGDWLAVSKRDGKPLKSRKDYEAELAYEYQFKAPFDKYSTEAMKFGVEMEPVVRKEYGRLYGVEVQLSGVFYNDKFAATPDGLIDGLIQPDGLLEIKVMASSSFMDVLQNGVPEAYQWQIQGQLLASGRKWCDFVAANFSTGRLKVIRVERDEEMIDVINSSLEEFDVDKLASFNEDNLFEMSFETDLTDASVNIEF